jgi:hypothetical protein
MFTVRNFVGLWPLVLAVLLIGLALAVWGGRF